MFFRYITKREMLQVGTIFIFFLGFLFLSCENIIYIYPFLITAELLSTLQASAFELSLIPAFILEKGGSIITGITGGLIGVPAYLFIAIGTIHPHLIMNNFWLLPVAYLFTGTIIFKYMYELQIVVKASNI